MKTFVSIPKYRCSCTHSYMNDRKGRTSALEYNGKVICSSLFSPAKGKLLIFADIENNCPLCHSGWRLEDR